MPLTVDIRKKLGAFQLAAQFEADTGDVLALLGASGSGKSMTLKCIAGIEKPDSGKIILNGRTLFDSEKRINLSPQKRRVGYLFQQYALFPNMTVFQNVKAGCKGRPNAAALAREKLAAMRLEGLEHKHPQQLSGGQQQRAALARILVNEPEVLLLDEPFSALDSYLRWELELELAETLRQFNGPAVFVSHSREEVFRLCRQVCVLSDGHSEGTQTVQSLFSRPETRAACLLSGCKNLSRVSPLDAGRVLARDWGVDLDTGLDSLEGIDSIGVKSRHFHLAREGERNTVPCTVLRVVEDERRYIAVLSTPGGRDGYARLNMTLDHDAGASLRVGETRLVAVEPADIMPLKK